MSEYQYYEFTTADRPLTTREQAELRSLSTRAEITATSFVNTYEWGNFKGDPRKLMGRYFDAHLYLTNWGTRELMLRLPKRVLDPAMGRTSARSSSAVHAMRPASTRSPATAAKVSSTLPHFWARASRRWPWSSPPSCGRTRPAESPTADSVAGRPGEQAGVRGQQLLDEPGRQA